MTLSVNGPISRVSGENMTFFDEGEATDTVSEGRWLTCDVGLFLILPLSKMTGILPELEVMIEGERLPSASGIKRGILDPIMPYADGGVK